MKLSEVKKFAAATNNEILMGLIDELNACTKKSPEWDMVYDLIENIYAEECVDYKVYEDSEAAENKLLNRLYVSLQKFNIVSDKIGNAHQIDILTPLGKTIGEFKFPQSKGNNNKIFDVHILPGYKLEEVFQEWEYSYYQEDFEEYVDTSICQNPVHHIDLLEDLQDFADYNEQLDLEFLNFYKGKYLKGYFHTGESRSIPIPEFILVNNPDYKKTKKGKFPYTILEKIWIKNPEYEAGYRYEVYIPEIGYTKILGERIPQKEKFGIIRKSDLDENWKWAIDCPKMFPKSTPVKSDPLFNWGEFPVSSKELPKCNKPLSKGEIADSNCTSFLKGHRGQIFEEFNYLAYRQYNELLKFVLSTSLKLQVTPVKLVNHCYGLRDFVIPKQDIPECFSQFPVMFWEEIEQHLPYKFSQVLWDKGVWYHTAIPELRKLNVQSVILKIAEIPYGCSYNEYSIYMEEIYALIPNNKTKPIGNIRRLVNKKALNYYKQSKLEKAWEELEKPFKLTLKNGTGFDNFGKLSKHFPQNLENIETPPAKYAECHYEEWIERHWYKITGVEPWSKKSGFVEKAVKWGKKEPWLEYDLTQHIPLKILVKFSETRIIELQKKWYLHSLGA